MCVYTYVCVCVCVCACVYSFTLNMMQRKIKFKVEHKLSRFKIILLLDRLHTLAKNIGIARVIIWISHAESKI